MPTPQAEPAARWSAAAYGLRVEGTSPVEGLGGGRLRGAPPGPLPVVVLAEREAGARWPADARRLRSAAPGVVECHPDAGWLLRSAQGGGEFVVECGAEVVRAPASLSAAGTAFLLGQVLPLAAGLHGIELLHAAAVVLDGAAIAIAGPSGAGKSTIAAALRSRGAGFLSEDVLAVGPDLMAHAGPATAGGRPVAAAVSLRAVCFPRRDAGATAAHELAADDPEPLLGAGYDALRRDPERLEAHLAQCARIAAGARLLRLDLHDGDGAGAAADALLGAL